MFESNLECSRQTRLSDAIPEEYMSTTQRGSDNVQEYFVVDNGGLRVNLFLNYYKICQFN